MRLRKDSWHIAGWKRAHDLRGCKGSDDSHVSHNPEYSRVEPAQDGDVWALLGWHGHEDVPSGYAVTCPVRDCDQGAHGWSHAYDCPAGRSPGGECKAGAGRTSCWTWSGDPADGTLTASPSLMIMTEIDGRPTGSCGYHGFLANGQMTSV